jgi:hypothetical protein
MERPFRRDEFLERRQPDMIRAIKIRRPVMVGLKRYVAPALALGLATSALATPSFAQRSEGGDPGMSAARAAAIHECSVKAGKYIEHTGATTRSTPIAPAWLNTASRNNASRWTARARTA